MRLAPWPVACAAGLSSTGGVARRSDTTWQMSSGEDGRRVVQVTMQKAGYGLWERCFAAEIPQHVHDKASEYSCLRRHCPARCPPPLKSPLLAVGQLEAQGRKLVAAGQQAIAEKDWSAAEDSLAQAAEVWATMESRTRGAEKGSYAPYAAAASEALEEVRREKGKAAASARPVGGCSAPLSTRAKH